jgi:hypothetical protein
MASYFRRAISARWERDMTKIVLLATAIFSFSTFAALAACPPGTAYNCSTTYNGKQSCGCR